MTRVADEEELKYSVLGFTYHTIRVMHSIQVDLRHKANKRGRFWISWSTFYSEAVHPVLIDSLHE